MTKESITQEDFIRIFGSDKFKKELRKSGKITSDTGYETAFNTYLYAEDGKIAVHPHYVGGTTGMGEGDHEKPANAWADYPLMVRHHFHPGFGSGEDIHPSRGDLYLSWMLRQEWAEKKGLYVLPLHIVGTIDDKRNIDLLIIQDSELANPLGNDFQYRDLDDLFEQYLPRPENVRDALNETGYYNAVLTRLSRGKYSEDFFEQLKAFEHSVRPVK